MGCVQRTLGQRAVAGDSFFGIGAVADLGGCLSQNNVKGGAARKAAYAIHRYFLCCKKLQRSFVPAEQRERGVAHQREIGRGVFFEIVLHVLHARFLVCSRKANQSA